MVFPDDPLDVRVELALGVDLASDPALWGWTDLNDDHTAGGVPYEPRVLAQSFLIKRGRADEASRSPASTTSVLFDNDDGALTPGNANSGYYPNIYRGTPMRLSLDGDKHLLCMNPSGGGSDTPDSAALSMVDDMWLAAEVELNDENGINYLIEKGLTTATQKSYGLTVEDGKICFRWSTTGADTNVVTSTRLPPRQQNGRLIVGVWCCDIGIVWWYYASTWGGGWTGFHRSICAYNGCFNSTSPLAVGTSLDGKIFRAEARSSTSSSGTLVASPSFTTQTLGAASFVDAQGNTWTTDAACQITDRDVRFCGQITEILPTWPKGDLSEGVDAGHSNIAISAAGILRRLGQGSRQVQSPIRRVVTSVVNLSDITAYWPMEETGDGALTFSSSNSFNTPPMIKSGSLNPSSEGTLLGSLPLPVFQPAEDSGWAGSPHQRPTNTWVVECFVKIPTLGAVGCTLIEVDTTGTWNTWWLAIDDTDVSIAYVNNDLGTFGAETWPVGTWDGEAWYIVRLSCSDTGATITYSWEITEVDGDTYGDSGSVAGAAIGKVTRVYNQPPPASVPPDGMAQGHVILHTNRAVGWLAGADRGWDRENAVTRIARVCGENNAPIRTLGVNDDSEVMGPQPISDLLTILYECVDADLGILTDQRDNIGLEYRSHSSLYNQIPVEIDAGADEIAPPFLPAQDDQAVRNDVTASIPTGQSWREFDQDSIDTEGVYEDGVPLNVDHERLADQAAWRLHTGIWPGMRYPTVTSNLASAPGLIGRWTPMRLGTLLRIIGLPTQHPEPTVDILLQGYVETLSPFSWLVEMNCTPGGIWTVAVLESDVLGRVESSGTIISAVDAITTSLTTVTFGPRWIDSATYPTEVPFDIMVNGERMTVTAIISTSTPQTFVVVRSVNGVVKSHPGSSWLTLADPMILAL